MTVMAHRQFLDQTGAEWTVYDVNPRMDERRIHERRDSAIGSAEAEERRAEDRRATVGAIRPGRLTRGWLCFESGTERRRLQPVPENWQLLPDSDLAGLLQQARIAPRRAG